VFKNVWVDGFVHHMELKIEVKMSKRTIRAN